MPLETDNAMNRELDRVAAEEEKAIEFSSTTNGQTVTAGAEVSASKGRWSVAAWTEWIFGKSQKPEGSAGFRWRRRL